MYDVAQSLPSSLQNGCSGFHPTGRTYRFSHSQLLGRGISTTISFRKIVVGAAAIRYTSRRQRNPKNSSLKEGSYFPDVFELPSEKVDPEDPTIQHALFREVLEETSLEIKKIFADLKPMLYTIEKKYNR